MKIDPKLDIPNYHYPSPKLLKTYEKTEVNEAELEKNKQTIKDVLFHYGIEIGNLTVTVGPTVILYEFNPPIGSKISGIRKAEDDISVKIGGQGARIVAPIPGKGTVGIEAPNPNPSVVGLKDIISSSKFKESTAELPLAMGKDVFGQMEIGDLTEMPHLLMAGATGQGKSVALNTSIMSMLYSMHPALVKFVFIDPKKVELSMYKPLKYHFLGEYEEGKNSIVSDEKETISVLKRLNDIMDKRYDLLEEARTRSVQEYNRKCFLDELGRGHNHLPYFVVMIDEFADLIMGSGDDVEHYITRLAQKARAVGIHLVVATQRPSSDVITGLIKANFPSRIAFKTSSKTDSRTILDANGAEQLVGKGDMLFSYGTEMKRLQSPFVDISEIDNVVKHISGQHSYEKPYDMC